MLPISKILRRKGEITERLARYYIGRKLTQRRVVNLTSDLQRELPGNLDWDTLYESLDNLIGTKFENETEFCHLVWRLLGNYDKLRDEIPVLPWQPTDEEEWAAMCILSARLHATKRGVVGYVFRSRILDGSASALVVDRFWSLRFCRYMSVGMGFSKSQDGRYRYRDGIEFVQMRFEGVVESSGSVEKPTLGQVRVPASMVTYNRALISARLREDESEFVCPYRYQHLCMQCPVGYSIGGRSCKVAVHPRTYETRFCLKCNEEAPHDPGERLTHLCVNCERKRVFGEARRRS